MQHIMEQFVSLPQFAYVPYGTTWNSIMLWKGSINSRIKLSYEHDGVVHETTGFYGGGWEDLVDHIVHLELVVKPVETHYEGRRSMR